MNKTQIKFIVGLLFTSVVVIATIWEFYLEDILGPLLMDHHHTESFEERLEFVITIAMFVGVSLIYPTAFSLKLVSKNERLVSDLQRAANEDHLTGLYNRRKISEELYTEIGRSKRYKRAFSIILIDIDNFKETNDRFGHNSGDTLLIELTKIIRNSIRKVDKAGRWGGEEFLVVCPETNVYGARSLAEKIRSDIASFNFTDIGKKTASLGVTAYMNDDDIQSIIRRADTALYTAKDGGKNRVEMSA